MATRLAMELAAERPIEGGVVWVTGMSAAGKTTLAGKVVIELRRAGLTAVLLDGDEVRAAIADAGCGHDRVSRLTNAYRIARLARLLAQQGMVVVVATMSLFHEIHAWNRRHLPGYYEVYLEVDIDTCRRRDPKGVYARARAGVERNVGGVDLAIEIPRQPHLKVANHGNRYELPEIARSIAEACRRR